MDLSRNVVFPADGGSWLRQNPSTALFAEVMAASPEPFSMLGGPITVVLLHGYTGAPAELSLLAEALHEQGFGVEAPLLAGHGTCLEDLMPVQPSQWLEQVDGVVDRLLDHGKRVVVAGLSLGSILAIQAGIRRPGVEAVIAYSPPIVSGDPRALIAPLLSLLLPSVPRPADDFVDPATAERLWKYPRWPSPLLRACAGSHRLHSQASRQSASTLVGDGQHARQGDHAPRRGVTPASNRLRACASALVGGQWSRDHRRC
ncbi:putative carboxylesterase [Synechococcus sp. BIOS-E4-1]|nr:putative carboxylesterase [Synechococcus sp. BIOS-E4-1]